MSVDGQHKESFLLWDTRLNVEVHTVACSSSYRIMYLIFLSAPASRLYHICIYLHFSFHDRQPRSIVMTMLFLPSPRQSASHSALTDMLYFLRCVSKLSWSWCQEHFAFPSTQPLDSAWLASLPEMVEGRNISSQIEPAIQAVLVHVAIFYANYAQTQWCLDELHLIVKSRATLCPMFYKVKPHRVQEVADLVDRFIKACDCLLLSLKVIGELLYEEQLDLL